MNPATAALHMPFEKSSSSSSSSKYLVSVKIRGVVDDMVLVDRLAGQEEVPGLGHEGGQVGGHQLAEELHKGLHQLQSLKLQAPACCVLQAYALQSVCRKDSIERTRKQ